MSSGSKKKVLTISGIPNPTMKKILEYEFGADFHDCKIDQKKVCFVAFISDSAKQDRVDYFKSFWGKKAVPTYFLRVVDEPQLSR